MRDSSRITSKNRLALAILNAELSLYMVEELTLSDRVKSDVLSFITTLEQIYERSILNDKSK